MSYKNITAGLVSYPAGATFGPRTLHDYELVYIHAGDIQWVIDDREYSWSPGTLVCVQPGMRDYIRWDEENPTTHSFVHFELENSDAVADCPLAVYAGGSRLVEVLMLQIVHLYTSEKGDADPTIHTALSHLVQCFKAGEVSEFLSASEQLPYPIERMFEFLRKHWQYGRYEDPGVDRLAQAAGVTPVHLNRVFKQMFGVPPGKAVRYLRMAQAADLLRGSNYQVQEIAELVGSVDPYHFSKQFKSIYGISPRYYRQRLVSRQDVSTPRHLYRLKQFFGL